MYGISLRLKKATRTENKKNSNKRNRTKSLWDFNRARFIKIY